MSDHRFSKLTLYSVTGASRGLVGNQSWEDFKLLTSPEMIASKTGDYILDSPEDEVNPVDMAWPIPKCSKTKVDTAGAFVIVPPTALENLFRSIEQYADAFDTVNNWRSAHSFPLNIIQAQLRKRARSIDPKSIVAQRLKRLSSIKRKLSQSSTRLSQMQDLGGCRAVVQTIQHVDDLCQSYKWSRMKHDLVGIDDYISHPKGSGYRGIHLKYKYRSTGERGKPYDGLKVEIQIRTKLQHAWATTLEIVDAFQDTFYELPNQLKAGIGNEKWLRYFALTASLIASNEGRPEVPGTPVNIADLKKEIRKISDELDVEKTLDSYKSGVIAGTLPDWKPAYFLMKVDKSRKISELKGYKIQELQRAQEEYLAEERKLDSGWNILLASSDSVAALEEAYPNYYMDASNFIFIMKTLMKE